MKNIKYKISNIKITNQNFPARLLGSGRDSAPHEASGGKKFLNFGLSFCILIFGFWIYSYAQSLSSTELIDNAKTYDGKTVVYTGEVIGEVMMRGEYAWANLNDGKNAIGAWLPVGLAREIEFKGSYKAKGDVVEVVGIFNHACVQHGGDLDIHAEALKKIRSGKIIRERINTGKRNIIFMFSGVLFIAWIWTRLKAK